jgi:hypothetical protein
MAARKPTKKSARKKTAPSKSAPKMAAKRDDFGASTDHYFAQQAPEKRALLEELRALVKRGVPDAQSSIKWGVPVYQRNGKSICSIAAFKEHVGINFFAPPSVLADPKKKLEGGGKSMRMLKVRSAADIDSASIQRWLKATVAAAG